MDEAFTDDVRQLHEQVTRIDELLKVTVLAEDLREKRADAVHDVAERNRAVLRRLWTLGLAVMLLWTPVTTYGVVWLHEKVRNNCYPGIAYSAGKPPQHEDWYCNIFPGTDRPK